MFIKAIGLIGFVFLNLALNADIIPPLSLQTPDPSLLPKELERDSKLPSIGLAPINKDDVKGLNNKLGFLVRLSNRIADRTIRDSLQTPLRAVGQALIEEIKSSTATDLQKIVRFKNTLTKTGYEICKNVAKELGSQKKVIGIFQFSKKKKFEELSAQFNQRCHESSSELLSLDVYKEMLETLENVDALIK